VEKKVKELSDPLDDPKAPKLNEDFAQYFVVNGLPICDAEKSKKLTGLLIKLLAKKGLDVDEKAITMPFGDDGKTVGTAFFQMSNEAKARQGAGALHEFQLDKKHQLVACQFNDYEKIMQMDEGAAEEPQSASLQDLKGYLL